MIRILFIYCYNFSLVFLNEKAHFFVKKTFCVFSLNTVHAIAANICSDGLAMDMMQYRNRRTDVSSFKVTC
jgi:hypothetical protein